jgi:hypothetical protein
MDLAALRKINPDDYGAPLRKVVASFCFSRQAEAFGRRDQAIDDGQTAKAEQLTAEGRAWDLERKRWHVDQQGNPCPRPPPAERKAARHALRDAARASLRDAATVAQAFLAAVGAGGDAEAAKHARQLAAALDQRT